MKLGVNRVLELETQDDAEYLKQLILGVVHNLCRKHTPETGKIIPSKTAFRFIVFTAF